MTFAESILPGALGHPHDDYTIDALNMGVYRDVCGTSQNGARDGHDLAPGRPRSPTSTTPRPFIPTLRRPGPRTAGSGEIRLTASWKCTQTLTE